MSRLGAFLEFLKREIDGTIWEDPSYRAYDLDRQTGANALQRAHWYAGYRTYKELEDALRSYGYNGDIKGPLVRWYVWHRLSTGEILKWPLRTKRENAAGVSPRAAE